jgi:hypothetical protein
MKDVLAEREKRFGQRKTFEFMPPVSWHAQRLAEAGFSVTEVVWRSFNEAVLVAMK